MIVKSGMPIKIGINFSHFKTTSSFIPSNNSRYIFDYFENKKEISNNTNKTKILNSFFKINSEEDAQITNENKFSCEKKCEKGWKNLHSCVKYFIFPHRSSKSLNTPLLVDLT